MKWLDKFKRASKPDNKTVESVETAPAIDKTKGSSTLSPATGTSAGAHAVSALSPRELQVFHRLLDGAKLKDIAAEIGVQTSTVGGYCREVYRKLGVHSRVQLVLQYGSHREISDRGGDE